MKLERRGYYRLLSIFPPSDTPQGCQPAIIGSTEELGEWDKTQASTLTPLNLNSSILSTSLLPAPETNERVEFRWVFLGRDDADIVPEVGSETERPTKSVDIEPDLWGLPQGFGCCFCSFSLSVYSPAP